MSSTERASRHDFEYLPEDCPGHIDEWDIDEDGYGIGQCSNCGMECWQHADNQPIEYEDGTVQYIECSDSGPFNRTRHRWGRWLDISKGEGELVWFRQCMVPACAKQQMVKGGA